MSFLLLLLSTAVTATTSTTTFTTTTANEIITITMISITVLQLFIYLFTCTAYPVRDRRFMAALYRGEEVTVHNIGISLFLSRNAWVLLSPPIESGETRPKA